MRKIYKVSREEWDKECAKLGGTPLPADSPYYNEGVSFQFVPRIPSEAPAKKPDGEQQQQERSGDE